ncbi:MAG: DUF4437 domain-containing protein [Steroidobacteraceae bacterium]
MARPHTCFVQAQMIPWSRGLYGGARPEVESKILSRDDTDGSATCIVRYPAAWSRRDAETLAAHEEFVVLAGELEINGRTYRQHSYAFLPAGLRRDRASSEHGAVLLNLFYGEPKLAPRTLAMDDKLLVEFVDPLAMDWDAGLVDPQLSKGVAIKPLRTDPYTQEVSFLYCSPPHRVPPGMAKPQWTHPMVEELYVIEGDYVWADLGRMRRGGYCWWREGVYHGPSGTDTGYNLFVRTVGGPLVNQFATEKRPFTWTPEHRPVLPRELANYGQPLADAPNY